MAGAKIKDSIAGSVVDVVAAAIRGVRKLRGMGPEEHLIAKLEPGS